MKDESRKARYMSKPNWDETTGTGMERLTRIDCFNVLTHLVDAKGQDRETLMKWYTALVVSGVMAEWIAGDFERRSELHDAASLGHTTMKELRHVGI